MDLTKYRNKLIGSEDERAVSPVIGVILMVAITVILAAVIAAFVLDIGDMSDPAPNTQFESTEETELDDGGAAVTFTVDSGESVDAGNVDITWPEEADNSDSLSMETSSEVLEAGDTVTLEASSTSDGETYIDEGEEVSLVWSDGESSTTLATHTATANVEGTDS